MKIIYSLILLACSSFRMQAQTSVSDAENAFAAHALQHTIRAAFLEYLDSSAVVFDKGEIFNGRKQMLNSKENTIRLYWKPVFSGTDNSGSYGFTTGPFELKKTPADTAFSAGQFSSIWKKQADGQWKVILDIGIHYHPSLFNMEGIGTFRQVLLPDHQLQDWQTPEIQFLDAYKTQGSKAFQPCLANDSWFNIDQHQPYHGREAIEKALPLIPADCVFTLVSGAISPQKDMIYVYGYTKTNAKTSNYLRVWVHTAEGWKIALQVL
ncbi:hypothetical protein ACFSQD_01360 [Flavihumibacter stibioxidans]|uniref:DUF4440 domain-containing protein n=1 Tax=Flavihumibacter stibioxidans TaxID=1834163 RepID=A0ABR7MC98_9BACT|nr:hypothetical protein [Flavihumibacter stibioxidans]MBC6492129.1 hypothetical protein [Flavihumibacter stibioxidans]